MPVNRSAAGDPWRPPKTHFFLRYYAFAPWLNGAVLYRQSMITEKDQRAIRQLLGAVKASLPGFVSRDAQNQLIATVANTLAAAKSNPQSRREGANFGLFEAGTGTGKTIALSVPGLVLCKSLNMPLIVSSSSVVLQEQLINKDLPFLASLLPYPLRYAVAKGRGRYICSIKLNDAVTASSQDSLDFDDSSEKRTANADPMTIFRDQLLQFSDALANRTWAGDRDSWPTPIDSALWDRVTTTRHACAGKACESFTTCSFYAARQQVKEADVIVCNHDVLFSSLDMAQGSILPDPAKCLFIIDEAHRIVDRAIDHFGSNYTLKASLEWVHEWERAMRHTVLGIGAASALIVEAKSIASELIEQTHLVLATITKAGEFIDGVWRFPRGTIPDSLSSLVWPIFQSAQSGLSFSLKVRDSILAFIDFDASLAQRLLREVGSFIPKMEELVRCWRLMMLEPEGQLPPIAKWVEAIEDGDYRLHATPIDAADMLTKKLWKRAGAVVLASATLRACASFDSFLRSTGLNRYPKTATLALQSPFDYCRNGRIKIPNMKADPTNAKAHTAEIVAMLPSLINERGVLVLFSSIVQMQSVFAGLPEALKSMCLMQGALPKAKILRIHRERIDVGGSSIIFGLSSFAEGVDLLGAYCEHVIIAKLFFAVHLAPIQLARSEWIESQGKSPFTELTLPEASVKLNQAVGRLLRSETDSGTITILDKRLVTKRYGKTLLAGLPPFSIEMFG